MLYPNKSVAPGLKQVLNAAGKPDPKTLSVVHLGAWPHILGGSWLSVTTAESWRAHFFF